MNPIRSRIEQCGWRAGAFTLVELLVVITIIMLLSGGVIVSFNTLFSATTLKTAGSSVVGLLSMAQMRAKTEKVPYMVVINRGDNKITVISSGLDRRFAVGEENADFAKDDEVIDEKDLNSLSTRDPITIQKVLNLEGRLPQGQIRQREIQSGVFIFTATGVMFTTMVSYTRDVAILQTPDDSISTRPDAWNEGTNADVIITVAGSKEQFMLVVDPVTGMVDTKVVEKFKRPVGGGGTRGGGGSGPGA